MVDSGLAYLLALHGVRVNREDGYWWKIEAWTVPSSRFIPHGIRYNLTLHDEYNTRIFGIDNSHAISPPGRKKYSARLVYDHQHRVPGDKGSPYGFSSAEQLLDDFFACVDEIIAQRERRG